MPMTVSCATPIASGSSRAAGDGDVPGLAAVDRCVICSPLMLGQVARIFSRQRKTLVQRPAGVLDSPQAARTLPDPPLSATVPLNPRLLTRQPRAPTGGSPARS